MSGPRCAIALLGIVAVAATAYAQEKPDAATLRKKAEGYEKEGFYPLAYRAYAKLSLRNPEDRAVALSAARNACEMRAFALAKKHVGHALALRESPDAKALAREIDAALANDEHWQELVHEEIVPRLLDLLESAMGDERRVAEVFAKDGRAQPRFLSSHVELHRLRTSMWLTIQTDSREAAEEACKRCIATLDEAAKGWTAERNREAKAYPNVKFGNAIRRNDPLARPDPDTFEDLEWAFPVKDASAAEDWEGRFASALCQVSTLAFGRREIKVDDDAALRGFSGQLYTVIVTFDGDALTAAR